MAFYVFLLVLDQKYRYYPQDMQHLKYVHIFSKARSHQRCVLFSHKHFLVLRISRSLLSQSRLGDYERCDMRARYYGAAVGRATCISGSRCVTRLIKILRDLLSQRDRGREEKTEKEKRKGKRERATN